ncbi:MAG: PorT family protein [FCB group bacterium]|nr:PorT family protein [FCB group bacterium]
MKKTLLTCTVIVLLQILTTGAAASVIDCYGFKAGLNIANVRQDGDVLFSSPTKATPLFGYSVGIYAGFRLNDHLVIQPEIFTSTKGYSDKRGLSFDEFGELRRGTITYKYYYVDFPLLLKYTYQGNAGDSQEIFLGPSVSRFLMGDQRFEADISWIDIEDDEVNQTDYGIVGGWGIEFDSFHFDGRVYYALTENFKDSGAKNFVMSLLVGYVF